MWQLSKKINIDENEFDYSFVRSSGSGGQKVNKTNSQVQLRWNLKDSPSLSESMRALLLKNLASKLTTSGELIISSELGRSQYQNKQDCLEKLKTLLLKASFVPKPRKKTKPTKASKLRRLKDKKVKSDIKKMRQKKNYD